MYFDVLIFVRYTEVVEGGYGEERLVMQTCGRGGS